MSLASQRPPPADDIDSLIRQMESLRAELGKQADFGRTVRLELPSEHQQSVENLFHYLALRSQDLRPLQERLARLGLSSLGRAEPHVLASIDAVLVLICVMVASNGEPRRIRQVDPSYPSERFPVPQTTVCRTQRQ